MERLVVGKLGLAVGLVWTRIALVSFHSMCYSSSYWFLVQFFRCGITGWGTWVGLHGRRKRWGWFQRRIVGQVDECHGHGWGLHSYGSYRDGGIGVCICEGDDGQWWGLKDRHILDDQAHLGNELYRVQRDRLNGDIL